MKLFEHASINKEKAILLLRIFLSLVFAVSAYSKLAAPGITEIILIEHGITASRSAAAIMARLLIGAEFSLCLLLLQKNYLKKIILPAVFVFLASFTLYLLYAALVLKDNQNCGCFGTIAPMSPVESIIKNIVLIGLTLILFRNIKQDNKKITLPLIMIILSFAAVLVFAPVRDTKDSLFERYTNFNGAGRVDLMQGEKLILLMSLDCDHCMKTAKEIAEMKKRIELPEIYTLFFKEGDAGVDSFRKKTGFSSPYKILQGEEFFEMIGSAPPRCYLLKGGKIIEFWDKEISEKILQKYSPR